MLLQTSAKEQQIDSSPCVRRTLLLGLHLIGMHGLSMCDVSQLPRVVPVFSPLSSLHFFLFEFLYSKASDPMDAET